MECLGCELVTYSAVTLLDGRTVCSSCPAWRHECEAREVAGMESDEHRRTYLAGVTQKRGAEAAKVLREDAWSIMQCVRPVTEYLK